MKQLIAIMAFIMVSQARAETIQYAQNQALPSRAAKKRTMVYDERTNELVDVGPDGIGSQQPVETVQGSNSPSARASGANPIVILNNQRVQGYQAQSSNQAQEMPTTIVEDSPLHTSAADHMRKKRQETENNTEDSIVQALERARMEDEVRRRDRFNNAIGSSPAPEVVPVAPLGPVAPVAPPVVVQPAPVYQTQPPVIQQVVPAPVVIAPVERTEREEEHDFKSEVHEAIHDLEPKHRDSQQYYVGAQVGVANYTNSILKGTLSSGLNIGVITADRFVIEGNFLYSAFQIDTYGPFYGQGFVDLKQYNLGATVKYQFLSGRIRPTIGATALYTRRNYTYGGNEAGSNAFDIGVVGGLDICISDSFSLGLDVRYLTNVFHRDYDIFGQQTHPWGGKTIEDIDYYTASVVGKFTF